MVIDVFLAFKSHSLLAESWDDVSVLIGNGGYGSKKNLLLVHQLYLMKKEREKYLRRKLKEPIA